MSDSRLGPIAAVALVMGGTLGMAGTFAPSASLRGLAWGLDGTALVVAAALLTIHQQSQLRLVPERRFAVALVTNSGRGRALNVHVLRVAMEAYFGVAPTRASPITMSPEALAEYAATYRRQAQDVSVTVDGDALKIDVTPKMPGLDGAFPPRPPSRRVGFLAKDRLIPLAACNDNRCHRSPALTSALCDHAVARDGRRASAVST